MYSRNELEEHREFRRMLFNKYPDIAYTYIHGFTLIPSENGRDCPANGSQDDIEMCCDECEYYLDCFPGKSFPGGE